MCSEKEWQKIKNEYVTTDIAMRPLAAKHNVSISTLKTRAVKENWTELREKHCAKVDTKVVQKLEKIAEAQAEEIVVTTQWIEDSLKEVALRCMQKVPVMEFDREEGRYVQARDAEGKGIWRFDSMGANKSLELLGKSKKMFTDRQEHSGSVGVYFAGESDLKDEGE
jgi:hypothetical protein